VIYIHIILSHEISSTIAISFGKHYFQYYKSSQLLFPSVLSCPDHYYAMHISDLLQFLELLIKLSKFPYKKHNGLFQKIKTNKYLCEYIIFTNQSSRLTLQSRRVRLDNAITGFLLRPALGLFEKQWITILYLRGLKSSIFSTVL